MLSREERETGMINLLVAARLHRLGNPINSRLRVLQDFPYLTQLRDSSLQTLR